MMTLQSIFPFCFAHTAMGTTFEVILGERDKTYASQASQAVFGEIDRIESLFSRFNTCSEIAQINLLSPGQSLKIGMDVFDCLTTAERIHSETRGAFDINFAAHLESREESHSDAAKGTRDHQSFPIKLIKNQHGYSVEFPENRTSPISSKLRLNLGGIGKGFALDRAKDILLDWGITQALIHGGTSTAFSVGSAPGDEFKGKGWPVGVGNTKNNRPRKVFHLKDSAVSGSGSEVKGRHILDPRSGFPVDEHRFAWVSHPSAAVADALSTAFMVMEPDEVGAYCERNPEIWALLVLDFRTWKVFNEHANFLSMQT